MQVEELLIAKGMLQPSDMERAAARRRERGGRITDSLLALGLIGLEQLHALHTAAPPPAPVSIEATGIGTRSQLRFLIKAIHIAGMDTAPLLVDMLKLPSGVVSNLLQEAIDRKLLEIIGSDNSASIPILKYALTDRGRSWANEALEHSRYVGPVPVPLAAFTDQVLRQAISNERVDRERITRSFGDLVVSDQFVNRVGPAINSGRSILLYGPPGNGKSSVAKKIGRLFSDIIYIPYCIEVEGQIIRIFDPSIHQEVKKPDVTWAQEVEIRRDEVDERWVNCWRPVVITGGELTLDMLDLQWSNSAKFYEAPLHVKAPGGTFVIDDFGRQLVRPHDMLNRWIIPLENRIDYLKLYTGKSFSLPFDELVIFSTNLTPTDLMDLAFLRRIPYKIEVGAPTRGEYQAIFERIARDHGMDLPDDTVPSIIEELQGKKDLPLGCYQPSFIVEQVIASCRFDRRAPQFSKELVGDALSNLFTSASEGNAAAHRRATANGSEHH